MTSNTLDRHTLIVILILPVIVYFGVAAVFGSRVAIEIGNMVVVSLAAGIVTAYWPVVRLALRRPAIDGGDVLSIGIFASWFGVFVARVVSIVWRLYDKPPEWLDSVWWGTHIALAAVGALCHLIAPEAIAGRVPARHWIRVGLTVAAGVFLSMAFVVLNVDDWLR